MRTDKLRPEHKMAFACFMGMILILVVCAIAQAQPVPLPPTTVQIAETKDGEGNWTGWTDLAVTWVPEPPAATLAPHKATDSDATQDWHVPHSGEWWHFSFVRTVPGEYAIRWCYGVAGPDSLWSPVATCVVVTPEGAVHQ